MCKARDIACANEKLQIATEGLIETLEEGAEIHREAKNGNHPKSH